MSTKAYCDGCGTEIERNMVTKRYRPSKFFQHDGLDARAGNDIGAEVMVRLNGTWNAGHLCLSCLLVLLTNPDSEIPA